jgi:hypothetical protein
MYRLTLKFRARHIIIIIRIATVCGEWRAAFCAYWWFFFHFLSHWFTVGYTMRDIRYKWKSGFKSVGISNQVQLPTFRILGHRQRATEINLSTGRLLTRDLTITHTRLIITWLRIITINNVYNVQIFTILYYVHRRTIYDM